MKRSLPILLALALTLGLCAGAFAESAFVDFLPKKRPAATDDFYSHVNFDTLQSAEISAGYTSWNAFSNIALEIDEALSEIVIECVLNAGTYEKGTPEQKIADLYLSFIDEESRNAAGITPIAPYLELIAGAQNIGEYITALGTIQAELGQASLLAFDVMPDLYDSTRYTLVASTTDTGLPKSYMENEAMAPYWEIYKAYLTRMFVLLGVREEEAAAKVEAVFAMQRQLALRGLSDAEYTDYSKAFLPMTVDQVDALLPAMDLKAMLTLEGLGDGLTGSEPMTVIDQGMLVAAGELLTEENLPLLKDYSTAVLLSDYAYYLSMDFRDAYVAFSSAITGSESRSLEEDSASDVQSMLSWDFGRVYAEKYFSEESKSDVKDMVAEILGWYGERIAGLDWMSEETKAGAQRKLETMTVKIGYPDDYGFVAYLDEIQYTSPADGGSLIGNILSAVKVSNAHTKSLLGKEVDKSEWGMTPQTVNAYYNPTANEIVFPAAIMQGVFYDPQASRARNLGAIGMVIGHEITHAFDSSGAMFDEAGNINMWWTMADFASFQALQQAIVDYYNAFEALPGAFVNGELTLGENIADLGAIHCVTSLCGDDPEALQDLFTAYATLWADKQTREMFDMTLASDTHSPGNARVNAVLSSTDAFYTAFDVTEGDGMYVAPEDRVGIW